MAVRSSSVSWRHFSLTLAWHYFPLPFTWSQFFTHLLWDRPGMRSPPGPLRRQGDLLQRLPGHFLIPGLDSQVAQRDDPDQPLVPVEDDQAADLVLLHQPGGLLHVLVLEAVHHVGGHHVL